MVRVVYSCLDDSPFPVEFADADDVGATWFLDREHAPEAMTPLADAVRAVGRPGEARAYAECGVTLPPPLTRARPVANGYGYHLGFDLSPEGWAQLGDELVRLAHEHGGNAGVWATRCLPAVQDDCAWLREAPPDTPFAALAERREHAWGMTAVAGLVARIDEGAVAAVCATAVGDRATEVARLLAQGSDNDTIAADRALARLAAVDPDSPEAGAARADFLTTYGERSTSWSIDHPTFAERPDLLDAQLRLLRRVAGPGADVAGRAADRRDRLVEQIASTLTGDERARFRRRVERLGSFVPVREARARWQLVASGAMRGAVRRRGRSLVDLGLLGDPDDVFFLTPAEYDDPGGDLRPVVAHRRVEHRHWRSVVPPPSIGRAEPDATDPEPAGPDPVLRGVGGAPGTATGPARVIVDLADAERLEVGDVLVTTMTSPAWTPLFGIASAVVTDAGDTLSHVAIAAREYGIPCVAGTHHATAVVTDGAPVTVDGDAGSVHLA